MTDYKATPAQWEYQEHWATEDGDAACLLELRSRIERLELGAGIHDLVAKGVKDAIKQTSNENQIRNSLLEQVHSCIVGEPECGHMQARAVIREIAAWLRDHAGGTRAAWMLEEEIGIEDQD